MGDLKSTSIALVIAGIIAAAISWWVATARTNNYDSHVGLNAGPYYDAARSFAYANRSAILSAISAAGGAAVSYNASSLQTAGLDPSLNGTSPTNGTWCLMFRSYNSGANLQGVLTVSSEVNPLRPTDAVIAAQTAVRPMAGMVNAAGTVVYSGGSQALSAFTGPSVCTPVTGALAFIISDQDSVRGNNNLARVLTGNPVDNRMVANLDMGGNTINNINNEAGTGSSQFAVYTATTSISTPIIYHTSDRARKTDFQPISDPWYLLRSINGQRYHRVDIDRDDYGVVAQDVVLTMPELVHRNVAGDLEVNYDGLIAPLLEQLKQDHVALARLQRKVQTLQVARDRARCVQ